jgi:hypothetical protein
MTLYNVHMDREVHLTYESIEADTAYAAADIALDRSVGAADDIDDCAGESFAAVIDVASDDQFEQFVTIEFEAERLRKAAPDMLDALREFIAVDELANECGEWKWESLDRAFSMARAAIAKLPQSIIHPERSHNHE